ncbi:metalloendoproteinase 2-MMP-like [Impatiens glandulifera]|uniref:metalloendoproteinase 2-MMP-like n=1 Tax=Impatiens glandulifera TaxID=253017 RepID=UPI001FB12854|nr:metalloendoproteinase 2-MMP-like [Impatiens glandulifera]
MVKPRCNLPDLVNGTLIKRGVKLVRNPFNRSYFTYVGSKWEKFNLTWALRSGSPPEANLPISFALKTWADSSVFRFSKASLFEAADVKISFYSGIHYDNIPFEEDDLAHSFYPPRGELHFNADVTWVVDFRGSHCDTADIETIAFHELGV